MMAIALAELDAGSGKRRVIDVLCLILCYSNSMFALLFHLVLLQQRVCTISNRLTCKVLFIYWFVFLCQQHVCTFVSPRATPTACLHNIK
jgi:hypothetical protein